MSRGTLDTVSSSWISLTGLSPSSAGLPRSILLSLKNQFYGPNPAVLALRFGLLRFRSPLLTESRFVFFSSGYLDVSVHRVPFHTLWIGVWIHEVAHVGFPIQISAAHWIFAPPRSFSQLITSFFGS